MRVCLIVHEGSMSSGGQGVYVSNLSRELLALGHEVDVISGPPYPELVEGVQLHRVRNYSFHRLLATGRRFFYGRPLRDVFHPLNVGELVTTRAGMYSVMGAFSIRAYELLRQLKLERDIDVVHDNQVLGYGTLLIKMLGLPVVATVHHPLDVDRANRIRVARSVIDQVKAALFYPFFMQKVVIRRLDGVLAVADAAVPTIAGSFGLDPERITVTRNGIDHDTFRPLPEIEPEPGRLLFVGDPEDTNKGFGWLLRALQELASDLWFHIVVVRRAWSNRAPALAREMGLEERTTFVDTLSRRELVEEYNRAQVLVAPSLYEGFGLPAAEALACGAPAVTTTVGAFPEIVDDGIDGKLVQPRDHKALASAIRALLDDPQRCRTMGEAGARRAQERFNWRTTAQETVALYEEVLGRRQSVAARAGRAGGEGSIR